MNKIQVLDPMYTKTPCDVSQKGSERHNWVTIF